VHWDPGKDARVGRRGSPPLELVAVGLDHTTAGIELRERVAFADAEIPAARCQLTVGARSRAAGGLAVAGELGAASHVFAALVMDGS
jgi:hypothetical protein